MNREKGNLTSLFLVSVALLLFEMTQIRVFAYVLTPILAYAAISLSMIGFGIGAMVLSVRSSMGENNPKYSLGIIALLQGVSIVLSSALISRVSWDIILSFQHNMLPLVLEILLPSILPHFFMGLFIARVFSSCGGHIGRVYFWNLMGSGLGCMALVVAITPLGAERLILLAGILSVGAAAILFAGKSKKTLVISGFLALAGIVFFPQAEKLFPFQPDPLDTIGLSMRAARQQGTSAPERRFGEWNVVGKVEVWENPEQHVQIPEKRPFNVLSVDSGGTTQLIAGDDHRKFGRLLFEQSIYGIAYGAKQNPQKVLVLGCGGGIDVQTALHFGAGHVTGVEINNSTIRAVTGPYASFLKWPNLKDRVKLIHADGRSYVKSTAERFDVIQMTGVDTITVYSTGSINMNEDSLYTVEAFEDYLRVLKPNGIYAVLRVGEDYVRLTAIATEALLRLGVKNPGKNIVAFKQDGSSGVLVKLEAFTADELDGLERFTARREDTSISMPHFDQYRFEIERPTELLYVPGRRVGPRFEHYFELAASSPENLPSLYDAAGIVVPTDDNPYYMLGQLLAASEHPGKFKEAFEVMKTFWGCLVGIAIVLIMLPVAIVRRRSVIAGPMLWIVPYFFLIGASFMLVEICIIHIFTIFIGSPGGSIAVVMTSILIFSGLGSYATEQIAWKPLQKILLATSILVASAVMILLFNTAIFDLAWSRGASQVVRGFVAGLLIAPLGLSMGCFFPTGLAFLRSVTAHDALTAWAVSINGFASVLGSVIVLPFSMYFGFQALFITAIAGYVLVALVSALFFRRSQNEPVAT